MQVAELIKEYLAVLVSWPVAIIIVVIILGKVFRPEIASLIGRITRIKAGPVDIASVAQEARAAGALQSKVEADVVHSIIHPFVPQLTSRLEKMHSMFTDPAQRVRVTLYVPWPLDNEHLVQLTPYLPIGPDKTGRLLSKRVGEVAENLRNLRQPGPRPDEKSKRERIMKLQDEIADVFSWILGLLNKLDQSFEKSREYYDPLLEVGLPALKASSIVADALSKWKREAVP